ATNGGLVVPRLYSLSNSVNPIAFTNANEEFERIGVDGVFANANFGFKELVFVELGARQDKSTTLPSNDNSYFYPSVGTNFVFSNLLKAPFLSHAKLRANYAEVGNDAPALALFDVYDKPAGLGTNPIFSLPGIKNNPTLRSERTKSYEVGIEAEFYEGRLGFDVTAYKSSSFDQILPVNVTASTGFTGKWVNSGEVQNKGIEISAFVTPIETNDFTWKINFNYTVNRNEVISLYGEGENEVPNFVLSAFQGNVSLNAAKGQPYGIIRGTDFVYTNGQRTVGANGYYLRTSASDIIIGNPNPDWTGGVNNQFSFKNVSLSFLIDVRRGGDIFSLDQWYGEATGLYANSAGLNARGVSSRLPVSEGGGILLDGVKADGSPNDIYGENRDGYGLTPFGYTANDGGGAPHKWYVYDGSYVKLREAMLTYSVPDAVIEKISPFKSIDISFIGRNLWILKKNMEYSDPEEGLSSGNLNQGYQSGAYPMVRNYGFNVKLGF
ncbi:MAG TPA: SusC/RagA family TonB-linked outer membrane protein, partial [Chryseosolibacter sp.]